MLLRRIVLVGPRIVLVRRVECEKAFGEPPQAASSIGLDLAEELIVYEEACEITGVDVGNDSISAMVNSIVEVAI